MKPENVYYLVYKKEKKNTAGTKAPEDIAAICEKQGYHRIDMPAFPAKKGWLYKKLWLLTVGTFAWMRLAMRVQKQGIIIYQHPSYGIRITMKYVKKLRKSKDCRFVAVVHDLESLRKGIEGVIHDNKKTSALGDNTLLKEFDVVICHNKSMKKYLKSQGFKEKQLVELEIFDYLSEASQGAAHKSEEPQESAYKSEEPQGAAHKTDQSEEAVRETGQPEEISEHPSISIAGNLAIGKCAYIYRIFEKGSNKKLMVHLYGNHYQEDKSHPNMHYHGSFPPAELPKQLKGSFGLVWDGISAGTCAGNTGEYLKYNNPHKASLYLASGFPVIVWSKAAIADFVKRKDVGITVDSLYDLESAIAQIDESRYQEMLANVRQVSKELQKGDYTVRALEKAFSVMEGNDGRRKGA